jgi:hypothetical protein
MFRPHLPIPGQTFPRAPRGYIVDLAETITDASRALGAGYSPANRVSASAVLKFIANRPPPTLLEIDTATALSIGWAMLDAWSRGGEPEVMRLMAKTPVEACLVDAIKALPDAYDALENLPGF